MATQKDYAFIGNGELMIAERAADGDPLDFDYLGNVTSLNIDFSKNRVERRNYRRKGNPIDKAANISTDAAISFTANDLDLGNLRLYFGGSEFSTVAGTVTEEPLPINLTDAKWTTPQDALLSLRNVNIDTDASIVVRHGADAGSLVVAPAANYTVSKSGDLLINQAYLSSLTPADAVVWEIDYAYNASSGFAAGSRDHACTKEYWLKLSGNNLQECGPLKEYQVADIYKVVLTPEGGLSLIGEELSELSFTGLVMLDTTRPDSDEWEEYFRVRRF